MNKLFDIIRRPGFYAERAQWKARHFYHSFRKSVLDPTPAVRALNRRQETVDYGPHRIFIEPASACNLRCPFCPTGAGEITRKHGLMKLDLVEKLVDEITHEPMEVGLWLGGEPMLNRNLVDAVRILARKNLPSKIHTNATLLTPEKSRELIEAGLQIVSFSFDGVDEEMYKRQRVGGDYHQTTQNLLDFLRIKKEMGSATPFTVIQTLIPYEGEEKHPYGVQLETPPEILRLFEGLPVDYFQTMLLHNWAGAMDYQPIMAPNHAHEGERIACDLPYTDLVITWNGDVVTCCGDLDHHNHLGNFYEQNLYELWNNEHFREIRRQMHTAEIEKRSLCGTCERLWTKPHKNDYELRLKQWRYRRGF